MSNKQHVIKMNVNGKDFGFIIPLTNIITIDSIPKLESILNSKHDRISNINRPIDIYLLTLGFNEKIKALSLLDNVTEESLLVYLEVELELLIKRYS